ncbi:uncharacterized protein [Amphiura filiformis]|uniref:uncharacterized protein n=1 Tax=Amphiura filiformis TaxID=82378 RepID=UPI003B217A22
MDVQRGCCWRCEKIIENEVACGSCGVAKYCKEKCREWDKYRHSPECQEWTPRQCSNPNCGQTEKLKECSACCSAWYCGATCQRQRWKNHKPGCQQFKQEILRAAPVMKEKFARLATLPVVAPFYIGNALGVDLLNLNSNENAKDKTSVKPSEQDPLLGSYSILSAGCGNLRNWILTVASLPEEFKGTLHTVLNDFDPFLQARNVLQLYMMIMYSDDPNIAERITTIWYSLHLPEEDYQFLVDCLKELQTLSAGDLANATGGIVQLAEADIAPMREVWEAWLSLECRDGYPGYINLHEQRQRLIDEPDSVDGIRLYRLGLPRELLLSYDKYNKRGDFVPFVGTCSQNLAYDNPTFTGFMFSLSRKESFEMLSSPKKNKFVYCIQPDLTPFGEWDYLRVRKHHYNKSMVVMYHSYISDQIKRVIAKLKAGSLTISIIVWNCLDLQTRLNVESCKFDRIFTSNIADYAGTQVLLKAMKPFLNRDNNCSTIVTHYWNWHLYFPWARLQGPPEFHEFPQIALSGGRFDMIQSCALAATHDIYSDDERAHAKLKDPKFVVTEITRNFDRGFYFPQEYFNYMRWFVNYLRAEYLAINTLPDDLRSTQQVPTFQEVKQSVGFQLRDFRKGELNKVVPFCYRRNVRTVNLMTGMDRTLEWHLP